MIDLPAGGKLQHVAILYGGLLALNAILRLHVQLYSGRDRAPLVIDRHEPHERLVVAAFHLGGGHFDLLDQLALVGVYCVQAIDHIVLVYMRCGVAKGAEWIHRIERRLARAGQSSVHTLGFVNY